MINWYKGFLTGRKQRVRLQQELGSWLDVTKGGPHGTDYGPVFFLVYLSDLECQSVFNMLVKYADDCPLVVKKYKGLPDTARAEVENIQEWCNRNANKH